MPITQEALTTEQLEILYAATLSESVQNRDKMIAMERRDRYLYNRLVQAAKKPVGGLDRGGVRINTKGLREQGYTWWDGTDFLPFEEHYTGEAMRFYVGKGHFGDMLAHDFAERAGIKMDYSTGKGTPVSMETSTRVMNIFKEKIDDIQDARARDLSKMIYKANADKPKAFVGLMGLHPIVNPTFGEIGGMSRSIPRYQHYVDATAWTADNYRLRSQAMIRTLSRKANGKSPNVHIMGDDMYDLIASTFLGTASTTGKIDIRMAQDMAMAAGEKYNITLPSNCFMLENQLIATDATLHELHEEDPSFGWNKLYIAFNTDYTYMIPVRKDEHIVHPVPYNQRVTYESWHDELLLVSVMPNSFGIATTAYAGTNQPW
jgi:hypothetical protein